MQPVNRGGDDRGASMVLVAIVLFSLIAVAALAVDTGALVVERRSLQNSADAAALAVGQDCMAGSCGAFTTTAGSYADRNANDGTTAVESVCGTGAGMTPCTDPPAVTGDGYVRVTTATRQPDGSSRVPFSFARVMGFDGQQVHATATAAWGGTGSLTSALPLTISRCEWSALTLDGTRYTTAPLPYPPYPPAREERTIYFHGKAGARDCGSGPSGADLPGGFGWLKTETDCNTATSVDNWFEDSTGVPPPNSCDPAEIEALVGKVVHVPVYDETNGLSGANGKYRIEGYAAFYLTGYRINGQFKVDSLVTRRLPCSGNDTCISGFFLENQIVITPGTIGGPSMGSVRVQLVE